MSIRVNVGLRISELRDSLGLTQAVLGERVGMASETISQMERGVIGPGLDSLEPLADALETSVSSLFAYVATKNTSSPDRLRLIALLNDQVEKLGNEDIEVLNEQIASTLKRRRR